MPLPVDLLEEPTAPFLIRRGSVTPRAAALEYVRIACGEPRAGGPPFSCRERTRERCMRRVVPC